MIFSRNALKRIFAVLAALSLAVMCAVTAFAAEPTCVVDFVRTDDGGTVTMTAVAEKCDADVNSALIVLEYDGSKLSVTSEDVKILSDGLSLRILADESCRVSTESAYLEPIQAGTKLASFTFTLKDGVSADDLDSESIKLCTDNDYIREISSSYSGCGGLMLTNGAQAYTANDGASAVFDLPGAASPADTDGGCSAQKPAVVLFAAAMSLAALAFVSAVRKF